MRPCVWPWKYKLGKELAVCRDVGANPEHHGQTEVMEFADHRLGVGESRPVEVEVAVVAEPALIDHEHSLGIAVGADRAGVSEHVFLVLVVGEFDPGVVLRMQEEVRVGRLAGGGKEAPADMQEDLAKSSAGNAGDDGRGFRLRMNLAFRDLECEWLVTPQETALVADEQGLSLIAGGVAVEIELVGGLRGKGHEVRLADHTGPPVLARQHRQVCSLLSERRDGKQQSEESG